MTTNNSAPTPIKKPKPNPFAKMTRRYVTSWHRWGPGKVHAMSYDREGRTWHLACRVNDKWGLPYNGDMVPVTADQPDITCKRCLLSVGGAA